jgi:hypothetical protein
VQPSTWLGVAAIAQEEAHRDGSRGIGRRDEVVPAFLFPVPVIVGAHRVCRAARPGQHGILSQHAIRGPGSPCHGYEGGWQCGHAERTSKPSPASSSAVCYRIRARTTLYRSKTSKQPLTCGFMPRSPVVLVDHAAEHHTDSSYPGYGHSTAATANWVDQGGRSTCSMPCSYRLTKVPRPGHGLH